jgi:hypothetical protein
MLAQGTPLYVVSEVLGHASIAVTKDVYGHLIEGDKRAATAAMSAALLSLSSDTEQLAPRLAPKPIPEGEDDTLVESQRETSMQVSEVHVGRARRDSNP